MSKKVNHLYIHIPFCKAICSYCDFIRFEKISICKQKEYVDKIIKQINNNSQKNQYKTIYIGGGTPNSLSPKILNSLLETCSQYLQKEYEFTIECNPEFVNKEQVLLLKKHNVNRVSLGAQSLNNNVLKDFSRKHNKKTILEAIKNLQKEGINNLSLDFIYGYHKIKNKDLKETIIFSKNNNIKHLSYYSLELKEGSILNKSKYELNEEHVEENLKFISKELAKIKYKRYEVSNWAVSEQYYSKHNLAYWNTADWTGIGLGAAGLENQNYYKNKGSIEKWTKASKKYSLLDYYQHVLIMGFRKKDGLDKTNKLHMQAFKYFENKINKKEISITKNNIKAKNVNLLNDLLISII